MDITIDAWVHNDRTPKKARAVDFFWKSRLFCNPVSMALFLFHLRETDLTQGVFGTLNWARKLIFVVKQV